MIRVHPTDTTTLAATLERAWATALPGRQVAARNEVLRAAQRPQTLLRLKTSGAQCGFL